MALVARFSAEVRHGTRHYRPNLAPLALPIDGKAVAENLRITGILRPWASIWFSVPGMSGRWPMLDREFGP